MTIIIFLIILTLTKGPSTWSSILKSWPLWIGRSPLSSVPQVPDGKFVLRTVQSWSKRKSKWKSFIWVSFCRKSTRNLTKSLFKFYNKLRLMWINSFSFFYTVQQNRVLFPWWYIFDQIGHGLLEQWKGKAHPILNKL